jgi:hypothetical protein
MHEIKFYNFVLNAQLLFQIVIAPLAPALMGGRPRLHEKPNSAQTPFQLTEFI